MAFSCHVSIPPDLWPRRRALLLRPLKEDRAVILQEACNLCLSFPLAMRLRLCILSTNLSDAPFSVHQAHIMSICLITDVNLDLLVKGPSDGFLTVDYGVPLTPS